MSAAHAAGHESFDRGRVCSCPYLGLDWNYCRGTGAVDDLGSGLSIPMTVDGTAAVMRDGFSTWMALEKYPF